MSRFLREPKPVAPAATQAVRDTVSEILFAVEREGVAGVRRYSERLDGWNPASYKVSAEEAARAVDSLDDELREAIEFAIDQVRGFAQLQRRSLSEFEAETLPGVRLGQRHIPVNAVGSYSPGGRYPMLASSIMTVVVPKVAQVPRVVACAPPTTAQGIHPPQLAAMALSGADEIVCQEPRRFGVGIGLQTERMPYGPPLDAAGHGGAGGSQHGCWPSHRVGFSYAMNMMGDDHEVDPRPKALLEALYRSVAG